MHHCLLAAALILPVAVLAAPPGNCGGFPPADNGPYDYRTVRDRRLKIVEEFHFTSNVEQLRSGNSSAYVGAELGFTLRAFPNHHRALVAAVRLTELQKTDQPKGFQYTIECYLERAVRFSSKDPIARMMYAQWLGQRGRKDEAMELLAPVEGLADGNPLTLHNLGLVYLQLGQHEQALKLAQQSLALGMVHNSLRDALKEAGRWVEPAAAPASAASS